MDCCHKSGNLLILKKMSHFIEELQYLEETKTEANVAEFLYE